MDPEHYELYVVGKGFEGLPRQQNINILGVINDDNRLAKVYSKCDYSLITSKADNLPNTVLESISCGTPVLGYKIGGIPDMINMTNGFLYDVVDELLAHLKKIKPFNETKREKIAVNAKKNFSNKKQVNSYIKLYNSLNS